MVTKENLKAFLEANKETEFVRCQPRLCPVAGYYKAQGLLGAAACGERTYIYDEDDDCTQVIDEERWVRSFINGVDEFEGSITGAEALAILEAL